MSAGFQAEARASYVSDNSADLRQGLRALARAVRRYAPYRARVDLDSGQLASGEAAQLFFSNLPFFGFGFEVDPGADPADGRFEAILLEARSRRRLLRLLAAARRGRHLGRRGVRRVAATRARVTEALPMVADAVPLGTTTATVTLEPARLRVAFPDPVGDAMSVAVSEPVPLLAPRRACAWAPALLIAFSLAAVGAGAGRALTTTYLPVLLERIEDSPSLIGAVMTVNAIAGFGVPIAIGVWSDRRGRRLPFIAGGAALTAGGLVAVGLGNSSSYVALGLAAGTRLRRSERPQHRSPRDRRRGRGGWPPPGRHERPGARGTGRRRGRRGHRGRPHRARARLPPSRSPPACSC